MEDPRQSGLFDVFAGILSPVAYRRLQGGWQHLFRTAILGRMPAGKPGDHFHPEMGRPSKELSSMAGLLFIMEFRDWTHEEASDAYMFNVDLQYVLNLQPEQQSLCRRTIERYIALFREDDLARWIMHDVTAEPVSLFGAGRISATSGFHARRIQHGQVRENPTDEYRHSAVPGTVKTP